MEERATSCDATAPRGPVLTRRQALAAGSMAIGAIGAGSSLPASVAAATGRARTGPPVRRTGASGEYVVLDAAYRPLMTMGGRDGLPADLHEFLIDGRAARALDADGNVLATSRVIKV